MPPPGPRAVCGKGVLSRFGLHADIYRSGARALPVVCKPIPFRNEKKGLG